MFENNGYNHVHVYSPGPGTDNPMDKHLIQTRISRQSGHLL